MDNLITEKELVEILRISRMTILRLRKKGMPYKKIGKSVRYNKDEVLNWIDEKK